MPKRFQPDTSREEGFSVIAADATSDEQQLWWKVLYQCVVDGEKLDHQNSTKRNNAKRAVVYLLSDQNDFNKVCNLANVNPDTFRRAATKWLVGKFTSELLIGAFALRETKGEKLGNTMETEMPLHTIQATGNPFIRFGIEENEWNISSENGLVPVDLVGKTIGIDIANIQMGWLSLSGGRDWQPWPDNNPLKLENPSDQHKQGCSVSMYSTKLFGDSPVRELSTSQIGMLDFVKNLYDEAEQDTKFKTHIPMVKMGDAPKRKVGKGSTRTPAFEITGWADRPDELGGGSPVAPPKAASVTSPDASHAASEAADQNFAEL